MTKKIQKKVFKEELINSLNEDDEYDTKKSLKKPSKSSSVIKEIFKNENKSLKYYWEAGSVFKTIQRNRTVFWNKEFETVNHLC